MALVLFALNQYLHTKERILDLTQAIQITKVRTRHRLFSGHLVSTWRQKTTSMAQVCECDSTVVLILPASVPVHVRNESSLHAHTHTHTSAHSSRSWILVWWPCLFEVFTAPGPTYGRPLAYEKRKPCAVNKQFICFPNVQHMHTTTTTATYTPLTFSLSHTHSYTHAQSDDANWNIAGC